MTIVGVAPSLLEYGNDRTRELAVMLAELTRAPELLEALPEVIASVDCACRQLEKRTEPEQESQRQTLRLLADLLVLIFKDRAAAAGILIQDGLCETDMMPGTILQCHCRTRIEATEKLAGISVSGLA